MAGADNGSSVNLARRYPLNADYPLRHLEARAGFVALVIALIFSAGHLTHEVRDADVDRRNGIATNAVVFGRSRTFVMGMVLFMMADVLLLMLSLSGIVPRLVMLVAAFHPVHFYWSLRALRNGLTDEDLRSLQIRYRIRYAVVGAILSMAVLLG